MTSKPLSHLSRAVLIILLMCPSAWAQMKLTVKGDVITMRGPVHGDECDELWILLQKHPNIKTIELSANGGDSSSGRCTGMLIRRYKLTTIVLDRCSSACASMWFGGVRRLLSGPKAYIGTHGAFIEKKDQTRELYPRNTRLKDVWVPNMVPKVDRALMEQWTQLPRPEQLMRFYQDRAELCDGKDCTPMPGRNIMNVGLGTE